MKPIRTFQPLHLVSSIAFASLVSLTAHATEGGVDNISPGTDGVMMLPLDVNNLPDNMFASNIYYNHYEAKKLNMSSLGGKVSEVKISSDTFVPRLDYLSPFWVLGGRLGGYVARPYNILHVSMFGVSDQRSSWGDITFAPIVLWDMGKNLTLAAAVEVTLPTGEYDATRLANTSNNFYTYKPVLSATWLPSERTELSIRSTHSFKETNPGTKYRSGQILHFDYSATYKVSENVRLGLNGSYLNGRDVKKPGLPHSNPQPVNR
ncbi:hypothetical protein cym2001_41780 [Pseudomonas sp. CYM-20-01]|nr:transporter [Pseudomonas sp. CYM-20-01]BDB20813.1 hypothetical protein cym2001_41780 [Pseudomonas sp. CYM-20-01]